MLPKKIDKKHLGLHVPRLAFLLCKERVESSILFGSTNQFEVNGLLKLMKTYLELQITSKEVERQYKSNKLIYDKRLFRKLRR